MSGTGIGLPGTGGDSGLGIGGGCEPGDAARSQRDAQGHGNLWRAALERNPEHSRNYARRWRMLEESGQDIFGEARFVDAMAQRESRILDAGCGTGRIGGWLSERGHSVVGVDLDPHLIDIAGRDYPDAEWQVGDLGGLDLLQPYGDRIRFDIVVMAGNVMTFVATDERGLVLERIRAHMFDDGRFVCGFGAGRGYEAKEFLADAEAAGLRLSVRLGTWDLKPPDGDFLVAIFEAD